MLTKKQKIRKIVKRAKLQLHPSPAPAYPGFVLGCQRSGTNMVMDVLDRSPEVECYNESDEQAFDNYTLRDINLVSELTARSSAKAVFFKCILSSQHARTLLKLNPTGRVVWMFRRYEDVINSNLERFTGHREEIELMLTRPAESGWRADNVTPEDMALTRHFWEKGISDATARGIMWLLRNKLLFQQELDTDSRVFIVNYDTLVQHPQSSAAAIFKFLDLYFDPGFIETVHQHSVRKKGPPEIDPELKTMCEEMWQRLAAVAHL